MQFHRPAVLAAVTLMAGAVLPIQPAAAEASTLYVDPAAKTCSDDGAGTEAQPYCRVSSAFSAAAAGQTVAVLSSTSEDLWFTYSRATPDRPIRLVGLDREGRGRPTLPSLMLWGLHDVTVSGFTFPGGTTVNGSSNVGLDNNAWVGDGSALSVVGGSKNVTISRNESERNVVEVQSSTGVVITDNAFANVRLTDVPDAVVTGNTLVGECRNPLFLQGHSTGAIVENNVIAAVRTAADVANCRPSVDRPAAVAVDADSVEWTRIGYNLVNPVDQGAAYQWAGTAYSTPEALRAAVPGQAAGDLVGDPRFKDPDHYDYSLRPDSPAVDSADAGAVGASATDLRGRIRVDHPLVANTGTGKGYYDRGAFELRGLSDAALTLDYQQAPYSQQITATFSGADDWNAPLSYDVDFGDGTPAVRATGTAGHTYTSAGEYTVTLTVTDDQGDRLVRRKPVSIRQPGPAVAVFTSTAQVAHGETPYPDFKPLQYHFDTATYRAANPWPVVSAAYDFGDGSAPVTLAGDADGTDHVYPAPGDYPVRLTVADSAGRTATAVQSVHVVYAPGSFVATAPSRLLDTRQAGGRVEADRDRVFSTDAFLPTGATAAVLNVTVTEPDQDGHLTAYPYGAPRPGTSNVNYTAGRTVPNLVTVPAGQDKKIALHINSGSAHVVVDIVGYYRPAAPYGALFNPVGPTRLLDTRNGTGARKGAVGPGGTVRFKVADGTRVPLGAQAAVLNVTATEPDSDGHVIAFAGGSDRPSTSNLNFTRGQTVPNQVIVPIGTDGTVSLYNSAGHTQLVADLVGYYKTGKGSQFTPVAPSRLLDTRDGTGVPAGRIAAGDLRTVGVAGTSAVPAGASAAALNVTVTEPADSGHLTVYPDGVARPGTSSLNYTAGLTVANHVQTPVGVNGKVDLWASWGSSTHAVADLFGYFTPQP